MSKEKTLKQLVADFEALIAWFESDDFEIEEAVASYKKLADLRSTIKKRLETHTLEIEKLQPE